MSTTAIAYRSESKADPALTAAFGAARAVCKRHAKSFYFASFFLPKPKRKAAYAVYAFCRMIDDAIDQDDASIESTNDPSESPRIAIRGLSSAEELSLDRDGSALDARLLLFQDRLNEIYSGTMALPDVETRTEPQHVLFALARTVERYEIPRQFFLDVAEGCRMDLTVSRYETWNDLEKYCYYVAGAVGLIMSCIFGLRESEAQQHAIAMGNAMQLTNILRDVREDWSRGRIYLPLEDLARFGYTEDDLSRGVVNDAFRRLMKFQVARARKLYRESSKGLCWLADDGSRLTAATMAVVYSGILDAIERQQYDVFRRRAALSAGEKIRRLPKSWKLARREDGQPMPRIF